MTEAVVECPFCGFKKAEDMPVGFAERIYTCAGCAKLMSATEAECCVYCKFSNMICPEQQSKRDCCSG